MRPPHMRPQGPRGFLTEEEKKNKPKASWSLIKRILSYLKPYTLQFVLVFVALAVSAVLGLFPAILTGEIVNEIISDNATVSRLAILLVAAFTVLALSQIISVLEQYINSWISQMVIRDMRNQMYSHLQSMPYSFFTTEKQGDIVTRMNGDINGVSSVISGTLTSIVSNSLTIGATLFYLFYTDWRLALVGIAIVPLLILPTRAVGKKRWSILTRSQEENDNMNQHINETLSVSGSMLMKLFTKEKDEYEKFKDINDRVTTLAVKENRTGSWFHVFMGMFMQLTPLLIYFAGGLLIIAANDKALEIGDVTAVVTLVGRLHMPVRSMFNIHVDFTRSLAMFTRIFEYFDRKSDIVNIENPKMPDLYDCTVEFCNVGFSYNAQTPILKNVSFKVPNGKMYAIVGTSGAGKSTLINLIPRLYDATSGDIKIANESIKNIDIEYLRKQIGTVSQDTYLFNSTILENLLYAKKDATREEIETACKIANIHDFIASLPDGYNTVVGNRGLKLSGGEKQRISIARVILKNPKILILDEATSSLDSISENLIQTALEKVMENRTCIVIAHRLSTVLAADRIMVLERGEITQMGTHDSLLQTGGKYKELYETQFKKILEHENLRNSLQ